MESSGKIIIIDKKDLDLISNQSKNLGSKIIYVEKLFSKDELNIENIDGKNELIEIRNLYIKLIISLNSFIF